MSTQGPARNDHMNITLTISTNNLDKAHNDIVRAIKPFLCGENLEGYGVILRIDARTAVNVDLVQLDRRIRKAAANSGSHVTSHNAMDYLIDD